KCSFIKRSGKERRRKDDVHSCIYEWQVESTWKFNRSERELCKGVQKFRNTTYYYQVYGIFFRYGANSADGDQRQSISSRGWKSQNESDPRTRCCTLFNRRFTQKEPNIRCRWPGSLYV